MSSWFIKYRQNSEAIFKSLNMNYTRMTNREIMPIDKEIKKLSYILNKAKRRQCLTPQEKAEHDRIK